MSVYGKRLYQSVKREVFVDETQFEKSEGKTFSQIRPNDQGGDKKSYSDNQKGGYQADYEYYDES